MEERLSIIIPAYNEETTILDILWKLHELVLIRRVEKEVLLIDDASEDATREKVEEFQSSYPDLPLKLFEQPRNQGKGAAVQRGMDEATGSIFVIQDADLEYDPCSFNLMLEPILDGFADVVYGSRFKGGASSSDALFLALHRESSAYVFLQYVLQPEPLGYGDLL